MTTKKTREQFDAFVRVTVETTVRPSAKTFEEAIAEAKTLRERDVMSFDTDFNDGSIEVTAILKATEPLR
jgi:hypothetical protein